MQKRLNVLPTRLLRHSDTAPGRRTSLVLFVLLFTLVFGPRLFGSFLLDTISIASVLVVAVSLVSPRWGATWVSGSLAPIGFVAFLLLYSTMVALFSVHQELFYPLKFGRALINYVGVYALCVWYFAHYGEDGANRILEHFFWAVAAHAGIMVAQYISSDIATVVYTLSGYDRWKAYRVTGLTVSYNTLSLVQGFGLLVGLMIQEQYKGTRARMFFLVALTLVTVSLFLAGRAAAYMMFFLVVFTVLVRARRDLLNRQGLLSILAVGLMVLSLNSALSPEVLDRFTTLTLRPFTEPVSQLLQLGTVEGTHGGDTAEGIFAEMYFLPDDEITLWVGSSVSGRASVYVPSDVGYVLSVFGIGLIGTAITVAFYVYLLIMAFRWRRHRAWFSYLATAFTLATLALNLKEQVLLTRHAFTVSMLLLCSQYITDAIRQGRLAVARNTRGDGTTLCRKTPYTL